MFKIFENNYFTECMKLWVQKIYTFLLIVFKNVYYR